MQAHSSIQCNIKNRKRTRDEADLDESEMCCIVSIGVDWIITKVKNSNGGENNDGNLELFTYSPRPLSLPINNELMNL
ncbi:hypothetical protein Glove_26g121 [Diversispora epigaea]|uniref:Uncharacterized protein n=1 Tax=Diversispora epigaea TaxID=1348612 RepID=A0A397JKM5_9GLOM|nr:hypothetical protein Glove_26g121 [Diversispora epigaea]